MTMSRLVYFIDEMEQGHVLPIGLAYDETVCAKYYYNRKHQGDKPITQTITLRKAVINDTFYRFPFMYRRCGTRCVNEGLSAANRDHWIEKVTGEKRVIAKTMNKHQPDKPKTSTEVFKDVLRMVNETPSNDRAEIEALRKENERLKSKLALQKKQVSNEEQKHRKSLKALTVELAKTKQSEACLDGTKRYLDKQLHKYKYCWKEEEQASCAANKRAETAEANAKKAAEENSRQLVENARRLEAAEKAAADAEDRVLRIWTEMKKVKDVGGSKRDSGDSTSDTQSKKMKCT
ncbi:hypothetical protein OPT61_g2922 [Boeremia exigua]|uniref:Uncharacterized protein n=1 Tax=Boeremia exigua TaxID=749465 RepID=A0ACC2IJP9_9PLEO|nr:hypothetical protein OPT61_g2922 [Boeremia exigua]